MMHKVIASGLLAAWLAAPVLAAAGFDATVQWSRRVELGMPVSGVVKAVNVDEGQRVAKDQVMVELDEAPFAAQLEDAKAQVKAAAQTRLEALRALQRAKELYEREVLAKVELDDARHKFVTADAGNKQAEAALALAQYHHDNARIKAPFDGVVVRRQVEPGQSISAELQPAVLVVFAVAGAYVARALVPGDEAGRIAAGRPASVRVNGKDYPGTVRSVGLEPDPADIRDPRYPVTVLFQVGDTVLRAGQRAEVELK